MAEGSFLIAKKKFFYVLSNDVLSWASKKGAKVRKRGTRRWLMPEKEGEHKQSMLTFFLSVSRKTTASARLKPEARWKRKEVSKAKAME